MADIIINRIKNISKLEFNIPRSGVHVLTAPNGCGKTTLLATLERLANPNAFPKYFRTSKNDRYNSFQNGTVVYTNNNKTVSYRYTNSRWAPTPRKNAVILRQFGFTQIEFISFDKDRIFVQEEDFVPQAIKSSSQGLKTALISLFGTNKYNELRQIKIPGKAKREIRRNIAFILPASYVSNSWVTEKNFSLGEILLINLVYKILNVQNNSLILIDEFELALHPKVQVNLLRFLENSATNKNLTIIISTHSVSLIKAASKLIYLHRNNTTGEVDVDYDCFPAIALQQMAIQDEVQPDLVFFIEDLFARDVLEGILDYYFRNIYQSRKPIYKLLPVGGWGETIRFTVASIDYLIPNQTNVYAMLDADVLPEIQAIQENPNRTTKEQEKLNLYNNNQGRIRFLPITPELGIVNLLMSNPHNHFQSVQDHFNGVFDIQQIILEESSRPGITYNTNPRTAAKTRLDYYISRIMNATNRDYSYVRFKLGQYYASQYCPSNHPALQQLLNPLMN